MTTSTEPSDPTPEAVERLREWAVFAEEMIPVHAGPHTLHTDLRLAANLLSASSARVKALEGALAEVTDAPELPAVHQWMNQDDAEAVFDAGLRHKTGKKPFDYLMVWLNMLRPFAFATRDDSWGEMEKLLCIVMRNYVRMLAKIAAARSSLTEAPGHE